MNNVEKQYENMLKIADGFLKVNEGEELSDDELDKLEQAIDNIKDPAQNFPSNNGKLINENNDPSQNTMQKVLVSTNPATGVMNTIPYDEENLTEESIDALIDMKDEDINKIEIGWDNFVSSTKEMYPSATEEGLHQLYNCVDKYRKGIKFPYYSELPYFIKCDIDKYTDAGMASHGASNNTIKQLKNMLAKELFETVISNNYSSKAFKDISNFTIGEIQKEKDKLEGSIGNYNAKLRKEYEENFIKKAEELEKNTEDEKALETAAKLRETSRMFIQAYTYEDMYEMYKNNRIKVKNIQVEKFNRTCQEFNRKYYHNTFQIKDVGMTIAVLDRSLDKHYDINTIKKFIVAFINYTKNYNPSDVPQHVFMFYFIQNILALDIKLPGNEYGEFNQLVKENIYKFLDLIIKKDEEKEELKKERR